MSKAIRDAYGEALVKYGAKDNRVVVLDADVSGSTKSGMFASRYPERFFNCGIAESAMTGIAAGFAYSGKIPFVNTFAVFISTICSVAARTYLSYSKLNVKLMGAYAGLSAGYDGSTHHVFEDVAIMRTMPNMTVMVASDEFITDWMIKTAIEVDAPMYIRLSRESAPFCHGDNPSFELGRGFVARDGCDATIFACGIMVSEALKAAAALAGKGIEVKVVDMFCIKPIDAALVTACAKETGAFVTAEEHSIAGGLGSAIMEELARADLYVPVEMVGVNDCHAESGAYTELLQKYNLDAAAIAAAAERAIARKRRLTNARIDS